MITLYCSVNLMMIGVVVDMRKCRYWVSIDCFNCRLS